MPEIKDCSKVFVVDTSVLIHDPDAIQTLGRDPENLVVIPLCILEELDRHKGDQGEKGYNCRAAVRMLDDLREDGKKSLKAGVQIAPGKGFVLVDYDGGKVKAIWPDLTESNDNKVLVVAKKWQEKGGGKKAAVVTKDINIRLKADAVGISAENYMSDKVVANISQLYSGWAEFILVDKEIGAISDLARLKEIPADALKNSIDLKSLFPNQCCKIYYDGEKYALAIFKKKEKLFRFVSKAKRPEERMKNDGIKPINDGQALLYSLLRDPSISLVTVGGKAGTGKSLIAFLAGREQVIVKDDFQSLLIYKPIIEVGKTTLGLLPGDLKEKMEPWMAAVFDNLNLIFRSEREKADDFHTKPNSAKSIIADMMENGIIEIAPISHIRGRSLNRAFIVIDEAQNLSPHEIKTLVTRAGSGSKVVLAGDTDQIDNPYLDSTSNGLSRAIEKFKNEELAAHITLLEGERSELAELAANIM